MNEIVWLAAPITNVCVAGAAAPLPLPAWLAVIEQVPAADNGHRAAGAPCHTEGLFDVKTIGLPEAPPVADAKV